MRAIIQRVTEAKVLIKNKSVGRIDQGLVILLGIEDADTVNDIDWLSSKIINMRIFEDETKKMNVSLKDVQGEILVVSQFTLHASTKKGNRPSFLKAANPKMAKSLYEAFIAQLSKLLDKKIQTGVFGAMMDVSLVNSGPVTIFMDSKSRE